MEPTATTNPGEGNRWTPWVLAAGLVALVAAVYARTAGFPFVNLDDQTYVYANDMVKRGLTWDGLAWAFGTFHGSNWHPLTWLSHMADVEFLGLAAGRHHVVNVALHALNSVLLLAWLRQSTGSTWRSGVVAALFAVHPLHVESVAWISERKDLLAATFWLLAMMAWVSWVRRRGVARYLRVLVLLALGLLSKPMVVTLPLALLLVDFWPLGRLEGPSPEGRFPWRRLGGLLVEKLPLLALSAAASVATVLAQRELAVARIEVIPLGSRIANAVVAYVTYLEKALWPAGLAALYPHAVVTGFPPTTLRVASAALVLAAASAGALHAWRSRPYLPWGWLWYLGTLVPTIGLVQVGLQSHADRYTYLPMVGILVAATWLAASLAGRSRDATAAGMVVATAVVAAYAVSAHRQGEHWRDSEALWRRALAVTEENPQAWRGLGDALLDAGHPVEGIAAHERALRLAPGDGAAANGMGVGLGQLGRLPEALARFQQAVRLDPRNPDAWYNLGTTHGMLGNHAAAAAAFERSLAIRPGAARVWENLFVARSAMGDAAGAEAARRHLEELDPARAAALRGR
jgi:protein O-mannosyl-transferase